MEGARYRRLRRTCVAILAEPDTAGRRPSFRGMSATDSENAQNSGRIPIGISGRDGSEYALRHAMTQFHDVPHLTGVIEADETYIGGKEKGSGNKTKKVPVFALVQRGGDVRSFVMPRVTAKNLKTVLMANVDQSAQLMTDSFIGYKDLGKHFAGHESINHSAKEYVRGPAHTNTVEGSFSLLKRGIIGTYHHVSEKHLHRYLAEFDLLTTAPHG